LSKRITFGKRLSSVLFWSLVSAAFIGPGTVATTAKAGANFGLALLWALSFSIIATILLQEASARITIASGKSLGKILSLKYKNSYNIKLFIFFAIAFGCAAYQTGNLIGAVSGITLFSEINPKIVTLLVASFCAAVLWIGNIKWIARTLGIVVAIMGGFFIFIAFKSDVSFYNVLESSLLPTFPDKSILLIISLIGTTIVPYTLFLSSGISKGQDINEMRWGLVVAILIGGLISMAILAVGTQVIGEFSFSSLAEALNKKTGAWAASFFAFGLCAAGVSSAITAPLAAAITAQSLFEHEGKDWSPRSTNFRLVSLGILLIGLLFSLLDIQPIPAIILAQAINGALLPIITIFLILIVNDKSLLPDGYTNSFLTNILMLIVVGVSCFLGVYNIIKAIARAIGSNFESMPFMEISLSVSIFITLILTWRVYLSGK